MIPFLNGKNEDELQIYVVLIRSHHSYKLGLLLGLILQVVTAFAIDAPVTYVGYHGVYGNPKRNTTTSSNYVKKGNYSCPDTKLGKPNNTATIYTIYSGYNTNISYEGPASCAVFSFKPTKEHPYLFVHFAGYMNLGYGGHNPLYQYTRVYNPSGTQIGCSYSFTSTNNASGDQNQGWVLTPYWKSTHHSYFYKGYRPWNVMVYDLTAYIGKTVKIETVASCCSNVYCYSYMYVAFETVGPSDVCASASSSIRLEVPQGLKSYAWLKDSPSGTQVGSNYYYNVPSGEGTNYYCRINGHCTTTLLMGCVERPIPQFDYTFRCGPTKDTVILTNTSYIESANGNRKPEAVEWDFGNGETSTEFYPSPVVYDKGSDHIITLRVGSKDFECDSTTRDTIRGSWTTQHYDTIKACVEDIPIQWQGDYYGIPGTYKKTLVNRWGCDSIVSLHLIVADPYTTQHERVSLCDNDYVLWHGQLLTEAKTYYDTLRTSYGCDSIRYSIEVQHRKVTYSDTYLTLCPKWIPYYWNGIRCEESKDYVYRTINAAGCDSVATLHLTINEYSRSDTADYICAKDVPYHWHGQELSTSGLLRDTVPNAIGCDSIITLTLVVHTPTWDEQHVHVCYGETYNWHGRVLDATGIYYDTARYVRTGCDSVCYTLHFEVGEEPISIAQDTIICENESFWWHKQYVHNQGIYLDTLRDRFHCDSIRYSLTVGHYPLQTSTTNLTICTEQKPYHWNEHTITKDGTYTSKLTDIHGCDSTAHLVLTIRDFSASDTTAYICSEDLEAQGAYHWHGKSLIAAGQLKDTVKNSVNCDSIITMTLVVQKPTYDSAFTHVCYGESYFWHGRVLTTSGIYQDTSHFDKTGCDNVRYTLTFEVGDEPQYDIQDTSICENTYFEWHGQTVQAAKTYYDTIRDRFLCDSIRYELHVEHYLLSSSATYLTICPEKLPYHWNGLVCDKGDTYSVLLKNSHDCDSTAVLYLSVRDKDGSDTLAYVCYEDLPYKWHGKQLDEAGVLRDTLTNQVGCDSVVTLHLTVHAPSYKEEYFHVCYGESQVWHSKVYSATGTYYDTAHYVFSGCDSVRYTMHLVVGDEPQIRHIDTLICEDYEFEWFGQYIHDAKNYYHTQKDRFGCDSIYWSMTVGHKKQTYSTTQRTICYEQLPYTWNGHTYTKAGNYTVHLTNAAGCDSTAVLQLKVRKYSASDTIVIRCKGEGPYYWHGKWIEETGTLVDSFINSVGCDSIVTLYYYTSTFCEPEHPIDPRVECDTTYSNIDTTLRYGLDTLTWYGKRYANPGLYRDTIRPNSFHCDSLGTLFIRTYYTDTMKACARENVIFPTPWGSIFVGQAEKLEGALVKDGKDSVLVLGALVTIRQGILPTTKSTDTTLCYLSSLEWRGRTITIPGDYHDVVRSSFGCDSLYFDLHVKQTYPSDSTTMDTICYGDTLAWYGYRFFQTTDTTIYLKNVAGCDSICHLHLFVRPAPIPSHRDTTLCDGQPIRWGKYIISETGIYKDTILNEVGCDSVIELSVEVLKTKDSLETKSICYGDSVYWHNRWLKIPQDYFDTAHHVYGCDSVRYTLHLEWSIVPSPEDESISFCQGDSVFWHGQWRKDAKTYYDTLRAVSSCDSVHASLTVSHYLPTESHTYVDACPAMLPYNWNGVGYSATGIYPYKTTNWHECDSTAYLHLTVVPNIIIDTIASICGNQVPYHWHGKSLSEDGIYDDSLHTAQGCDSIVRLHLYITRFCGDDHPIDPRVDCDTTYSITDTLISSDQLPYTWFGHDYTKSGIYHDTIKNVQHCDSIGTLILRACPVVAPETLTHANISKDEIPYTWRDFQITKDGEYRDTVQTAIGCDSVLVLRLHIREACELPTITIPYRAK